MSEVGRSVVKADFIILSSMCELIPWEIIQDNSVHENEQTKEDMDLFESVWSPPIEEYEIGDAFRIKGDITIVYSKTWTDCGDEYDVHPEFNEDLIVTKLSDEEIDSILHTNKD